RLSCYPHHPADPHDLRGTVLEGLMAEQETTGSAPDKEPGGTLQALTRTRGYTALSIGVERLWPLILPALLVVSLFLILSWFGVFRLLPDWLRLGTGVALALLAIGALYPLRKFRRPTRLEIDRRIEISNRLAHAPVSTQSDRLEASGDAFAEALGSEPRRRMAGRLGELVA